MTFVISFIEKCYSNKLTLIILKFVKVDFTQNLFSNLRGISKKLLLSGVLKHYFPNKEKSVDGKKQRKNIVAECKV